MYDMHKELNEFYEEHVRLKDEQKKLAEHRDSNLNRLKDGLKKLDYPHNFDSKNQGSYAMNTINKHLEKKYDIDVAVIFEKDDLPSNPADARKRIEDAVIEGGGNFSTLPRAMTNAVRVSYAEGYHVDLAVYRKHKDIFGNAVIEHAGPEWTARNPVDITNWFTEAVQSKSPKKENGSVVAEMQLRRIVRWLKMFSKSRSSWDMPGGLVISTLAVENYASNSYRDDSALYDTMVGIRNRLSGNKEVFNPVVSTQYLTSREKDKARVKNFEKELDIAIGKLNPLFNLSCRPVDALKAWNEVFDHFYWAAKIEEESKKSAVKKDGPVTVKPLGPYWNR